MGIFSSKKKTTYYSNHLTVVKMDKQYKPYINALVMSAALRNDRYTSATDIIKDGIFNSPKQGLSRLFKYQAKAKGKEAELYAPSGDLSNFDFSPYLPLSPGESYSPKMQEISFFEPDYYVLEWMSTNRPDLIYFRDIMETEYIKEGNFVSVTVGQETFSVKVPPTVDINTPTIYMEYAPTSPDNNIVTNIMPISTEMVDRFDFNDPDWSPVSSRTEDMDFISEVETIYYDVINGVEVETNREITYVPKTLPTRLDRYMNYVITEEERENGLIGKQILFRETIRSSEKTITKDGVRYETDVRGRFRKVNTRIKTVSLEPYTTILKQTYYFIQKYSEESNQRMAFIYPLGGGYKELDDLITTRLSLGYKANPLVIKRWERLVSPTNQTAEYDFNNKSMKKYSGNTSSYKDMYEGFAKDGLSGIKEAIMLYGVSLDMDEQFAIEYCNKFFSTILDFYNINEGTYNANSICRQQAGNLYYNPNVGNVRRKKHTGVPNKDYKIGRVYVTRNGRTITYTERTSPVTYTTITVQRGGQSVQSSVHWINHGVSASSDSENKNSGAVIPLLQSVIRKLPVKYVADVAKYAPTILLTTYETVKIKWYQRSIFKVVMAVVIIVVSIFFPPAGGAMTAVAGTIGATVATFMSLSGLAYLVIAHAVNMVIGMVVASLVSATVNKFVGGVLGQLVSVVLTSTAMGALSGNMTLTDSFTSSLSSTFSMKSIMEFSNINRMIGYGVNQHFKGRIQRLEELQQQVDSLKDQLLEVKEKTEELYSTGGVLSTMDLMDSLNSDILPSDIIHGAEMPETYLYRATLTGDDMVDMSLSVIYDYVDMELSVENFVSDPV